MIVASLSLALLFSISSVAVATEPVTEHEITASPWQVTQTIDRSTLLSAAPYADDDFSSVKQELRSLGMSEQTISDMDDWYLLEYSQAERVVYSKSYFSTTLDGNVAPVSEATALAATTLSKLAPPMTRWEWTSETSYMKMEYIVLPYANQSGLHSFRTEATWLLGPSNTRGVDVLGMTAQLFTVTNDTRTGWIKADKRLHDSIGNAKPPTDFTQTLSSFVNANDGTFYGSAAYVRIPKDTYSAQGVPRSTYSNIRIAYYYQGYVISPDAAQNLNVTSSYLQQVFGFAVEPSVTIGTGGFDGSLTISHSSSYERAGDIHETIHYAP